MIRHAILLAGAIALAPMMGQTARAGSGEADRAAFIPPETTQILTRTVQRSLSHGREIVVIRSYRISFTPQGNGYRVDGELVAVEVDAPQSVRALAELERNRPDTGPFPIYLDANGRIVTQGDPAPDAATGQSAGLAIAQIGGSNLSQAEQAEAANFVRQIAQQGANNPWPHDLFNPVPGNRTEVRWVQLPQGGEGEVSVSVDARSDPVRHFLDSFDRTVITRLGDTERLSRESWTIQPLSPTGHPPLR